MTIEQKAKAYDEAINRASGFKSQEIRDIVEHIFPELRENEDEKIRKNCIHFLKLQKQHHAATFEIEECISWLEKQGKQKSAWSEEDEKQARQIERIVHDDGCTQKLQKQITEWLRNLKNRVQSQYKPTGAQLASLEIACDRNDRIGFDLTQLLKDLKKL